MRLSAPVKQSIVRFLFLVDTSSPPYNDNDTDNHFHLYDNQFLLFLSSYLDKKTAALMGGCQIHLHFGYRLKACVQ
jgi:hypothetical protein